MPYVRLAGILFDVEECEPVTFHAAGKLELADGSFRKYVYGTKRRWRLTKTVTGWEIWEWDVLRGLFMLHAEMSFIDLEGNDYQVLFEDDELAFTPKPDVPWYRRRYEGGFALRQV